MCTPSPSSRTASSAAGGARKGARMKLLGYTGGISSQVFSATAGPLSIGHKEAAGHLFHDAILKQHGLFSECCVLSSAVIPACVCWGRKGQGFLPALSMREQFGGCSAWRLQAASVLVQKESVRKAGSGCESQSALVNASSLHA